jgi:quercetin dioxygenase-like cupin family protein
MQGHWLFADEVPREVFHGVTVAWLSRPALTGAKQLLVLHSQLEPGAFHTFHRHPNQEELLFVLSGTIEQWVGEVRHELNEGDAVFIPRDVVHAAANTSGAAARVFAVTSPSIGATGHEMVDVGDQEPWVTRARAYRS